MSDVGSRLRDVLVDEVPAQRIDRVWNGIAARRRRGVVRALPLRARAPALAFVALVAAAAVVLFVGFSKTAKTTTAEVSAAAPTTARPGPLHLATGGSVAGPLSDAEPRETETVLDDGSRISIASATELVPVENDGSHFSLRLSRGRAIFDVVPGGPRTWTIDAGNVKVTVLGTKFRVDRSDARIHVGVERGLVRVTSDRMPGGERQLRAGEFVDVILDPASASASAPPPTPAPVPKDARDARDGKSESSERKKTGDSASELLAVADRARASGRPRDAVAPLERIVREHPESSHAAIAAFTLGKVQADQLGEAARGADSFERAVAIGLPASLAEEAWARIAEIRGKQGDLARASSAAQHYLATYPGGRHESAMMRWSGASP